MDDTNPTKEDVDYVESIIADVKWLIGGWADDRLGLKPCGQLAAARSVQVRFRNNGGKRYLRAEAHLIYRTPATDATRVTFDWTDGGGARRDSHIFGAGTSEPWEVKTGRGVQTRWIEFATPPR